jgi:hypothetical protein
MTHDCAKCAEVQATLQRLLFLLESPHSSEVGHEHVEDFVALCPQAPGYSTDFSSLYAAYVRWCGTDRRPLYYVKFGKALTDLGFPVSRTSDTRSRIGLHTPNL